MRYHKKPFLLPKLVPKSGIETTWLILGHFLVSFWSFWLNHKIHVITIDGNQFFTSSKSIEERSWDIHNKEEEFNVSKECIGTNQDSMWLSTLSSQRSWLQKKLFSPWSDSNSNCLRAIQIYWLNWFSSLFLLWLQSSSLFNQVLNSHCQPNEE